MSTYGYSPNNKHIRALDERIRRVVTTKSAAQLEREKLDEERMRDIAQMLRANEGDCRPARNR